MPHRAMLTPADDFFGRVALFNGLINLDQIVECARTIGAELVAGRPRRSLATMLILKGYLSAKAAGAVEAAVRRHLAKSAGGAAAPQSPAPTPPPKPPVMVEHVPSGSSQIVVTLEDDGGFVDSPLTEDRLQRIVARISPGLIYPEMLSYIVKRRLSMIDGRHLAADIGEPEAEVFAALHHWQALGILKKVATHPYGYAPEPHDERDIGFLLDAWNDPRRHARVLGFILAAAK